MSSMSQLAVVAGAFRYEYRMQIRRVSVWVVLGLLCLLIFGIWSLGGNAELHGYFTSGREGIPVHWVPPDPRSAVLDWVQFLGLFVPLGIGLVLADRLARDKRTRVDQLLDTAEGSPSARLTGKFLGSTLATLTPLLIMYFALVAYMVQQTGQFTTIVPLAVAGFAAVLLPAALFVAGFSVTLPLILRVPVYQFLFTGYWFWANLMSPKIGIPSIVGTMLNAAGPWAQEGIFNYNWTFLRLNATPAQGYLSIALLSGLGLAAVLGMGVYLRWQHARR